MDREKLAYTFTFIMCLLLLKVEIDTHKHIRTWHTHITHSPDLGPNTLHSI